MTGAHAGVDEPYVLWGELAVFCPNLRQLRLNLWFLLGFLQIVVPLGIFPIPIACHERILLRLGRQQVFGGIGMAIQPESAQRIFHHVTNDPVRGEQLGDGRNLVFGDSALGKGLAFWLSVIVLVQPADDLHLAFLGHVEIALRNVVGQVVHHAVGIHEGNAQQQLCILGGMLKQAGQHGAQGITPLDEQHPKQLVQLVLILHGQHRVPLLGGEGQVGIEGPGDNIRLQLVGIFAGEHPDMIRQVVVDLHKPDGNQTVEPGIGNLLHHKTEGLSVIHFLGLLPDGSCQGIALPDSGTGHLGIFLGADVKKLQVGGGLLQGRSNLPFRDSQQSCLEGYIINELSPGVDGKHLNGGFIHGITPFSYILTY